MYTNLAETWGEQLVLQSLPNMDDSENEVAISIWQEKKRKLQ